MASVEQNIAAVRRLFDEISAGNMAVVDEVMIPEFVTHGDAMFPYVRGTAPLKMGIGAFKKAFPDARLSVEHIFGEGDKVVARVQVKGTHSGEWLGVAPTNAEMTWTSSSITRFNEEGKMAERWVIEDELAMLEQLGIIKAVGAAPREAAKAAVTAGG